MFLIGYQLTNHHQVCLVELQQILSTSQIFVQPFNSTPDVHHAHFYFYTSPAGLSGQLLFLSGVHCMVSHDRLLHSIVLASDIAFIVWINCLLEIVLCTPEFIFQCGPCGKSWSQAYWYIRQNSRMCSGVWRLVSHGHLRVCDRAIHISCQDLTLINCWMSVFVRFFCFLFY